MSEPDAGYRCGRHCSACWASCRVIAMATRVVTIGVMAGDFVLCAGHAHKLIDERSPHLDGMTMRIVNADTWRLIATIRARNDSEYWADVPF